MALVDTNTSHSFKDLHANSAKLASTASSPSKNDGSTTSQSSPRGLMSPNSPVSVTSADSHNHSSSGTSRSPSPSISLEDSKTRDLLQDLKSLSAVASSSASTAIKLQVKKVATPIITADNSVSKLSLIKSPSLAASTTPPTPAILTKVSSNLETPSKTQKTATGTVDKPKKKYNVDKNKEKKQAKVNVAATGISTTIPVTGERPRPEKHSSLDDEVLFTIFQILFDFDANGKGMTVKQICDILLQKHPETAKLSSKTSNLVSAKLNAYVKRIEKGDKSLTYALSREWADTSPKRMVYVYRGILTDDFDVHAKAAIKSLEESFHHKAESKRLAAAASIDKNGGSKISASSAASFENGKRNDSNHDDIDFNKNQNMVNDNSSTSLINSDWVGSKKTKKMSFSASDFAISGNVLINNNAKDNFDQRKLADSDSKGSCSGRGKTSSNMSNVSAVSMKVTQLLIPFNLDMEKLISTVAPTLSFSNVTNHERSATTGSPSASSLKDANNNGGSKSFDVSDFMDEIDDSLDIGLSVEQPAKRQKLNNLTAAAAAPRVPKNFVNSNQSPGIVLAAADSLRAAALHALAPNVIAFNNGFLAAGQDIGNPEDISLAELDNLFE